MPYYLYLKKQKPEELLAMSDAFLQVGAGKHSNNIYFTACMNSLKALRDELSSSIVWHEQKGLALESKQIDKSFDALFTDWRSLVEVHAGVGYLATSAACAEVSEILNRIERDLHAKSKPVQIALFDSLIAETESLHAATGFEEVFDKVKSVHAELKTVENSRAEMKQESPETPYKVGERVKPILALFHDHLEGFSLLGDASHEETLVALHAQIAPIITAVKARIAKEKNGSAEAPEE